MHAGAAMAIYRHFPDHAALLAAVADRGFAELAAALQRRVPRGHDRTIYIRFGDWFAWVWIALAALSLGRLFYRQGRPRFHRA